MSNCAIVETKIRKQEDFIAIAKQLKMLIIFDNEDGSFTIGSADPKGSFAGIIKFFCSPDKVDEIFDSLPGLVICGSTEIYLVKDR